MYQHIANFPTKRFKYHLLSLITAALLFTLIVPVLNGSSLVYAQEKDANYQKANDLYKKAKADYDEKKWETALSGFLEAYQIFPKNTLTYYIALTYENLKEYEKAQTFFEDFLKNATDAEKIEIAKKSLQDLKEILKTWTTVEIKSNPIGAEVFVDQSKKPKGKTPVVFKVPTQVPVKLTLKLAGYDSLTHTAKYVKKEGIQPKTYQFKTKGAFVSFTTTQKGVKLLIDGKKELKIPASIELPLGEHKIEASLAEHSSIKQSIVLEAKHSKKTPLTVAIKLEPAGMVSKLRLNIDEAGAEVYLNGKQQGTAPIEELSLKAGKYLLEVKGKMGEFKEEISLAEGENLNIDITLQKTSWLTTKKLSTGLIVTGGTAIAAGLVWTALAFSSNAELDDCRQNPSCARGQGELNISTDVKSNAFLADIFTISGLVIAGTGTVLYFLNQKSTTPPNIQVTPTVGGAAIRAGFEF